MIISLCGAQTFFCVSAYGQRIPNVLGYILSIHPIKIHERLHRYRIGIYRPSSPNHYRQYCIYCRCSPVLFVFMFTTYKYYIYVCLQSNNNTTGNLSVERLGDLRFAIRKGGGGSVWCVLQLIVLSTEQRGESICSSYLSSTSGLLLLSPTTDLAREGT